MLTATENPHDLANSIVDYANAKVKVGMHAHDANTQTHKHTNKQTHTHTHTHTHADAKHHGLILPHAHPTSPRTS